MKFRTVRMGVSLPLFSSRWRWWTTLQPCPGGREHVTQDPLHFVEVDLLADQRWGQLDDRLTAIVGAAVQPGLPQRLGHVPAQHPLGLLERERLLGHLVLDQSDAVE